MFWLQIPIILLYFSVFCGWTLHMQKWGNTSLASHTHSFLCAAKGSGSEPLPIEPNFHQAQYARTNRNRLSEMFFLISCMFSNFNSPVVVHSAILPPEFDLKWHFNMCMDQEENIPSYLEKCPTTGYTSGCVWSPCSEEVLVCTQERARALTKLVKWACLYAAQASLWWQADDSAVIGLISLKTWQEDWRQPQGSGAYRIPTRTGSDQSPHQQTSN